MNKREKTTARISLIVITAVITGGAYFILKAREVEFFPTIVKWIYGIFIVIIYSLWGRVICKWMRSG